MKFDFCIGNPPYQEEQVSTDIDESQKNYAPPVYHLFMDAAFTIADKVELIHPARFLFNAGSTPQPWNKKMLNDKHFKVLMFENDSTKVFANKVVKGGIAITYRDRDADFGAIKTFSSYPELNSILNKVLATPDYKSIIEIVFSRTSFRMTRKLHDDYPKAKDLLSEGHLYDMASNILYRLPFIFLDKYQSDGKKYIKVLGRLDNERVYKYIRADYINEGKNRSSYKVFVPQASGTGQFGESLGTMIIGVPNMASTETFLSIGKFDTEKEALNLEKYLKTKMARCLLSVLKVTQIGNRGVYEYIPLQDFTSNSDIDWSKSVKDIDRQLYAKYGLSDEEIAFIESHVKEMA